MRGRWMLAAVAALMGIGLLTPQLRAALLTIDEAIDVSERTGRPIFAVAGSAT